jgi:DTW domain-containing protein YfiP
MYLNLYIAQGDKAKGNIQIECHKCHKHPNTCVLDWATPLKYKASAYQN